MSKICLKCGHENPETPSDPLAACPKCGAIYSRVEAHLEKQAAMRAVEQVAQQAAVVKEEAARKSKEVREVQAQTKKAAEKIRHTKPKHTTVVKTYQGRHKAAMAAFQSDAKTMAKDGYVPTTQQWAPGAYGCSAFIIALLLCFVLVGIIVFVYMLLVKPLGVLSVTYEFRESALVDISQSGEEKVCPKCAENVKAAAVICRYCGHKFN